MNYYDVLPDDYKLVKTIDAKGKKDGIILTLVSIMLMAIAFVIVYLIRFRSLSFQAFRDQGSSLLIYYLVFLAFLVLYFVLHELTHGAVYKLLTKKKLTFGLTLTVAFCGVPDIYVKKKTALASVLAPLIVYSIIFLPLCFVFNEIWSLMFILLFSVHFGGCIGDMIVARILFKLDNNALMNDTGPKQTFYVKEEQM